MRSTWKAVVLMTLMLIKAHALPVGTQTIELEVHTDHNNENFSQLLSQRDHSIIQQEIIAKGIPLHLVHDMGALELADALYSPSQYVDKIDPTKRKAFSERLSRYIAACRSESFCKAFVEARDKIVKRKGTLRSLLKDDMINTSDNHHTKHPIAIHDRHKKGEIHDAIQEEFTKFGINLDHYDDADKLAKEVEKEDGLFSRIKDDDIDAVSKRVASFVELVRGKPFGEEYRKRKRVYQQYRRNAQARRIQGIPTRKMRKGSTSVQCDATIASEAPVETVSHDGIDAVDPIYNRQNSFSFHHMLSPVASSEQEQQSFYYPLVPQDQEGSFDFDRCMMSKHLTPSHRGALDLELRQYDQFGDLPGDLYDDMTFASQQEARLSDDSSLVQDNLPLSPFVNHSDDVIHSPIKTPLHDYEDWRHLWNQY